MGALLPSIVDKNCSSSMVLSTSLKFTLKLTELSNTIVSLDNSGAVSKVMTGGSLTEIISIVIFTVFVISLSTE